ncbi:MAG: hypothetical protein ACPGRZ_04710 [Alphaproteobacteria bacterium]
MAALKRLSGTFLAFVFLGSVLAACVADDGMTGTGPFTLNAGQKANFEKWAQGGIDRDPLYFFVTDTGGSYWVYCPDTAALCREALESESFHQCNSKVSSGSCKLYAVYGEVVWKFHAPPDPSWRAGSGAAAYRPVATRKDTRRISGSWKGELFSGSLSYSRSNAAYKISISIPRHYACSGSAEFTRNTWSVSCDSGLTASGTFTSLDEGEGSIGDGTDKDGNPLTFRVWPAGG